VFLYRWPKGDLLTTMADSVDDKQASLSFKGSGICLGQLSAEMISKPITPLFLGFSLMATDTGDSHPTSTPGCKSLEQLNDSAGHHSAY